MPNPKVLLKGPLPGDPGVEEVGREEFREGLGPTVLLLLRTGVIAVEHSGQRVPRLLPRIRQRESREAAEGEAARACTLSVKDEEGLLAVRRDANPKSGCRAVVDLVADGPRLQCQDLGVRQYLLIPPRHELPSFLG